MRFLITLCFLLSTLNVYAINDAQKTQIYNKNLLLNGGFENGTAKWTASAGTFSASASAPMSGLQHGVWNAAASTNTLTTTAITIPAGMKGRNGVASCLITTASGTATHSIQAYDGSSILSTATVTSSTIPTRNSTNFVFPSSGSVSLRFYANADEPSITIDDCFLGPAEGYNLGAVGTAAFIGGMESAGASTCAYSENTSAGLGTFVDLGTSASCAAWTVVSNGPGVISAQGTNDHRLVYTDMPTGNYIFNLQGYFQKGATSGTCVFRLSDGTNTYQPQSVTGSGTATNVGHGNLTYHVNVTTGGTKTFKLQAGDDHVDICAWNNAANLPASWKIYRFPTASEMTYSPDKMANSWSGYHDATCSWARTNVAHGDPTADGSCALIERTNMNFGTVSGSNDLPEINFTPSRAGRYFVCANPIASNASLATSSVRLVSGATVIADTATSIPAGNVANMKVCGVHVASSTASQNITIQTAASSGAITLAAQGASVAAVEWSIFQIDQNFPAPVLANSVVSPSSGVVKMASFAASSAGVVSRETGEWITSDCSVSATSTYTCTIPAGVFSTAPNCAATVVASGPLGVTIVTNTTTSLVYRTFTTTADANSAQAVTVVCMGVP